ncbi:MAG: response regulator [Proteobacteria bacterium]|nr:response regulator [Pseudomonadota bacterium]
MTPRSNQGEAPPHILVVDDDRRLRDLLQQFLVENGYMVTTVEDAGQARARLKGLTFDLIVLDIMMPGESGLELTQSLRADNDVPILLLSAMGEAADRVAGFESGADDYLAKPFEPRELLLRIASILRRAGPPPEAPQAVRFGDFLFDPATAELHKGDELVHLTSGEAALMGVFAANPGITLTRQGLSLESKLSGNERAVDVHIARLRRKVEDDPKAPRYIQTVWGEGYVLRAAQV